jgi:hypothetical protein
MQKERSKLRYSRPDERGRVGCSKAKERSKLRYSRPD